jgi:cysteine desulfurase/selenocysteine lyase
MKNKGIRKQFPILNTKINGKKLIYLDSAATTQKPERTINALSEYYSKFNSNIHRSSHQLAKEATRRWVKAHQTVADFINAKTHKEIIFTRNSTEGINLFVNSYGRSNLTKNETVIITEMEHHSNIVPWQILKKEIGFNLEYIPITEDFELDLDWLEDRIEQLGKGLKIVSLVHVSNVLGTTNDVKKVTEMAHKVDAVVLVDAAQSVARLPIDVEDIDCDALVFSGHKIYGPTGIGVIYVKKNILTGMSPYMAGGEMIEEVHKDGYALNDIPWRFEAGTPDIADGVVLAETLDWFKESVEKIGGYDALLEHEKFLVDTFLSSFEGISWFKIFGQKERIGSIAFNLEGFTFAGCKKDTKDSNQKGEDILEYISSKGLCIRDGFHCAQPLHERFDKGPTMRVSFGIYNNEEDVKRAAQIIKEGVLRVM